MLSLTIPSWLFVTALLFLNTVPTPEVMHHVLVHGIQFMNDESEQEGFSYDTLVIYFTVLQCYST
jgi:hypothetical protein